MLQIEEWFRKPTRRTTVVRPKTEVTGFSSNKAGEMKKEILHVPQERQAAKEVEDIFEQEPIRTKRSEFKPVVAGVEMADEEAIAESETMEQITEQIGQDVTDMIGDMEKENIEKVDADTEKEDILLQQIDEFRAKAKQLQELMAHRENKAKELQGVVEERSARADELDNLIQVRQGEADKIMYNVSEKIDTMTEGVHQDLSGLEGTLQKEVGGLTQNLTQEFSGLTQNLTLEISQSSEKNRQLFEEATRNLIDQNTRSLEGVKEQLEQLGQLDQIGELSTEMNTKITTLQTDIADKIHAEDVKCYRNIQASMDEQSKLLSAGDELTRKHVQEQMGSLDTQVTKVSKVSVAALVFSVFDFLGIVGIIVILLLL